MRFPVLASCVLVIASALAAGAALGDERILAYQSDITVNAVHPGLIFTNLGIGNNRGFAQKLLGAIWSKFSLDESEGHRCPTYAATAQELDGVTGQYIADSRVSKLKPIALKDEPAKRLWEVSEATTGVRFPVS